MYQSLIELISDHQTAGQESQEAKYQSLIELISDCTQATAQTVHSCTYQSLIELISDKYYCPDENY